MKKFPAIPLLLLLNCTVNLHLVQAKIGENSASSIQQRRRLQLPDFMCSIFGVLVDSLCEGEDGNGDANNNNETLANNSTCPLVQPLADDAFDIKRFTEYTWFVQKQQINGFQYSPEDEFYCLAMTYTERDDTTTTTTTTNGTNTNTTTETDTGFLEDTKDSNVFYDFENYGVTGSVNGSVHEWDGDNTNHWCAGQDQDGGGLLRISPCVLRPLLVRVGIPQWVLAVDEKEYAWAIMSGGEPSELVVVNEELMDVDASSSGVVDEKETEAAASQEQEQGSALCTTRTDIIEGVLLDTSGSGLWILTRERIASPDMIAEIEQVLLEMGIYTGKLFQVVQEGCTYSEATLVEQNQQ